jgi:Mg-chelatase subunit ChlD
MTLTHPSVLWLLLLLPLPFLLARRRTPARRQVVSNLYLWRSLIHRDTARPTLRRIRRHWLVALQMAFMATAIAALAHPTVAFQATRVAFVFDVSGSMAAHDGPVSRLDRARQRAQSILNGLPRRSRVRLIAAGASARDLGDYAATDRSLARALEMLAPTAGPADLAGALDLARIADAAAVVHVFSDRSRNDSTEPSDNSGGPVSWETVGRAADNLAVARVAARRLPLNPVDGQVLVEVRNYGGQPRDTEVEIAQDGRVIAREALHVVARGKQTVAAPATRLGHVISARLLGEDALDADNRRWTVVPPLKRVRVAIVNRGSPFLEKALAVNPAVSLQNVPFDRVEQTSRTKAEPAQPPDVVVCEGCRELPRSRGVLIVPPGAGSLGPAALTVVRPDHPIATSLDFGGLFGVSMTAHIVAFDGDVIVRVGDQPAVVAYEHDGQRIVEFRLDVTRSDLALSTAFPILVANAVDWLAARNENPLEIESGEPLRWTLPEAPASDGISVTGPDGRPRHAQLLGRRLTIVETDLPGVYRVRTPASEQAFAVNAAVDSESDLIPGEAETTPLVTTHAPSPLRDQTAIATLLLLLASSVFAVEWWFRRGRTIWRLLIAGCLILSASGLVVAPRDGHLDTVAILDRSSSVPVRAQERGLARVNAVGSTMRRGDRLGVVAFGADAVVERRPAERVQLSAGASTVVDTGTNIEAALRLARHVLPREGSRRILLISDGRETIGDARKEAAYAAAAGIRVDVAQPDIQGIRQQSVVTRVAVPSDVRIGEPFLISVEIEGAAGARGQLSVYRDDEPFSTRDIRMSSAGTASAAFSDRQQHAGIHMYRAQVRDADDDFDQAREAGSGAVVSVSGEPTVLYVSSSDGDLRSVLAAAGFLVTHVLPESLPASSSGLVAYDAVVLDDVPAARLGMSQMSALARYIEQSGGGLMLLGSSRSLDLAGYPTGALGRILPVDLRPRAGQRAPSLGLVLVFDKSGSMADLADGTPKIEIARQAVMKVLDVLPSNDALGVIAFDADPIIIAPLASNPDARAIAERLRTVDAGGPTRIAPAAELALRWLGGKTGATASRRQILLLSDGRTSADDAERLRAAIGKAGVELSVVAIGSNADRDLLRQLAQSTGGRAYFPADVAELPLIVSREAARSAGGTVVEERFTLRGVSHPILAGIDRASLPQLGGYVVTAAKPTATSILTSHLDDPILCAWRAGLGRVSVFTADLGSPWSASLRHWRNHAQLWTQAVRWVSRRADDPSLRLAITEGDDFMRISVEADHTDGSFLNLAEARAIVRLPTGDTRELALSASAPGRYEARLTAMSAGPYVISVDGQDRDGGAEHRAVRGVYWSADRERRARGADVAFLTGLAEMTGGRLLGPTDSPFSETRPKEYVDVSIWLVAAALAMFVLDLVVRRGLAVKTLPGWLLASCRSWQNRRAA